MRRQSQSSKYKERSERGRHTHFWNSADISTHVTVKCKNIKNTHTLVFTLSGCAALLFLVQWSRILTGTGWNTAELSMWLPTWMMLHLDITSLLSVWTLLAKPLWEWEGFTTWRSSLLSNCLPSLLRGVFSLRTQIKAAARLCCCCCCCFVYFYLQKLCVSLLAYLLTSHHKLHKKKIQPLQSPLFNLNILKFRGNYLIDKL